MSSVYLYSKRDIANVIRDLAQNLVENMTTESWYQEHGMSVSAQALQIWLDRLNRYDLYSESVYEDARKTGATVRGGE